MSADLYAAFGVPQWNASYNSSSPKENDPDVVPKAVADEQAEGQQWILQSQPIPRPLQNQPNEPLWRHGDQGTEVLFDASDDDREDDFGDFEEIPGEVEDIAEPIPMQMANVDNDLLGLDNFPDLHVLRMRNPITTISDSAPATHDLLGVKIYSQSHDDQLALRKSQPTDFWDGEPRGAYSNDQQQEQQQQPRIHATASDDDWGNFEEVEAKQDSPAISQSPKPRLLITNDGRKEPEADDNDDWDAFEDSPSVAMQLTQPTATTTMHQQNLFPMAETTTQSQPSEDFKSRSRPTNIPPPSTLLQLLPRIYQTLSQQSRLQTLPSDLGTLILQIYVITARIIAGRSYRWKRDTLLSQSTRISQAGLKNTGMKLTALDKSETIKEDQEAQEAVTAWQRHAATLNTVMLKARVQKPPMSLSSNLTVRSGTGTGVLNARECCAVCGLKRNERVTGIDVKVEDLFGEFWVGHWGHKDCCEFWYRYEGLLNKR